VVVYLALKKLCRCGRIIDYGRLYCDVCTKIAEEIKQDRNRYYDKNQRDKEAEVFYHSQAWIKLRDDVIRTYNGLCLYSLLINNEIVPADIVHHIISIKQDKSKSLDKSNLIPVCSSVHNAIEAEYDKGESYKKLMQSKLFQLLEEYQKRYGVGGV
jgi:5-methylcytosine-specific restriction protein A